MKMIRTAYMLAIVANIAMNATSFANTTPTKQILTFRYSPRFANGSEPEIFDSWFFEITKNAEGLDQYTRRDYRSRIFNVGARVGCMATFDQSSKRHVFITKLHGPRSLRNFHPKADLVIHSKDGRSVFTISTVQNYETHAGFWYSIDPGDPTGSYTLTCTLDGELVGHYEFDVE